MRPESGDPGVVRLDQVGSADLPQVGGKNASLGEMIRHLAAADVRVPGGFATTADAFRRFLATDGLDARIAGWLDGLDAEDVRAVAAAGRRCREAILATPLPADLEQAVRAAHAELATQAGDGFSVAVRSSATAEDLPEASFAGQQETFLNVRGIDEVIRRIHEVFASLYNDRAITYRLHHGFDHRQVALSAGVQRMVRSDRGASGVLFTMDTESGFRDAVFITASYGLGELVVQGAVNPDEFYVHKPTLAAGRPAILRRSRGEKAQRMIYGDAGGVHREPVPDEQRRRFCLADDEIQELARMACAIEAHYGCPMDIEWGKDGLDGQLYVLQARPETVQSRAGGSLLRRYRMQRRGEVLAEGRAIGQKIGSGRARRLESIEQMHRLQPGEVLVTDMTDPDWEPIMKKGRDRHESRRPHLPRRDHRARDRHPGGGRLRRRDHPRRGWRRGHGVLRRRRQRLRLRRPP
jgi:phosphoenolpyruvate synthase (EC 2.7.9.2)